MSEPITFGQLSGLLEQLGFCKKLGPKDHLAYLHKPTDTVLYFPPLHANELVPMAAMIGTRKLLVDNGIASAEHLDHLLHAIAA